MSDTNTTQPDGGGATGTPIPEALLNADPGLSKFSSVEALAKSYGEAQKTLGTKMNEVSDLNKKFDALTQQLAYDPDKVDVPEGARDHLAQLKEMGVPEEAAKALAMEKMETRQQLDNLNGQYEEIRLEAKWGNNTQQRRDATTEWAEANLPEAVSKPLLSTADGLTTLYAMMKAQTQQSTVTDPSAMPPEAAATKKQQIENELHTLRTSEDFDRDLLKKQRYNSLMNDLAALDT